MMNLFSKQSEERKMNDDDTAFLRDYSSDNIRFLLIFLVVFAHFLKPGASFKDSWLLYKVIYSFHMPALLFLFGYYVKYSSKRIVFRWVIPYFVFQTLYLLFDRFILNNDTSFQYTKPYWLLWYMLVCIFYQILIPIYENRCKKMQWIIWIISVLIALFVGYEKSVGYYMSLSRFFVFQPWFLLGFYCRKNSMLDRWRSFKRSYLWLYILSAVLAGVSVVFLFYEKVPNKLLYGSYAYSKIDSGIWMRAALIIIALNWIVFLFATLKLFLKKRIFCITTIGQNTFPIFLLHGFLVKFISVYRVGLLDSPWKIVLISGITVFFLGNKFWKKAVDCVGLCWLEKEDMG